MIGQHYRKKMEQKLVELQTILDVTNSDKKLKKFNDFIFKHQEVDQIFIEYILDEPKTTLVFVQVILRISEKKFDLLDKEEFYFRKIIQTMLKKYEGEINELMELFSDFINIYPEKSILLFIFMDEFSKLKKKDPHILIDLLSNLEVGTDDHFMKFFDFFLPIVTRELDDPLETALILDCLTKIIDSQEQEKKFQMVYKCVAPFFQNLETVSMETLQFLSMFGGNLTKEQFLDYMKLYEPLIHTEKFESIFPFYFEFFAQCIIKFPMECEEMSLK
jgi:hypothetical protein